MATDEPQAASPVAGSAPAAAVAPAPAAPARAAAAAATLRRRRVAERLKTIAPLLALLGLCLLIESRNERFLSFFNLVRIANTASIALVLALGETFVVLLGSVDLSVEGVLALGAVIVSISARNDLNSHAIGWFAVPLAVVTGAAVGWVNGLVHVKARIPSFMVTLGTGFIGIGLATLVLRGMNARLLDEGIRSLALSRFLNFPLAVWVALGALLVAWGIERGTVLGRHVFAVGGGEDLAALSGIRVDRVKILTFMLAGAFYGLGGVLAVAQLGQGSATIGDGRLFSTITAVVVGGTSLSGGAGGTLNTLVGVLIIAVIGNGMVLLGLPPIVQPAVQGLIIILAVALSTDRRRLKGQMK